jgi:hypothetical protein
MNPPPANRKICLIVLREVYKWVNFGKAGTFRVNKDTRGTFV